MYEHHKEVNVIYYFVHNQ